MEIKLTRYIVGIVTLLLVCVQWISSARILVILPPTHSAITPFLPAIEELRLKYGHQSTIVFNEDLAKGYQNSSFDYIISKNLTKFKFATVIEQVMETASKGKILATIGGVINGFSNLCNAYLSDKELSERLLKKKFDLAIIWKSPLGQCLPLIPYKLSIPFITFGNFDIVNDRIPFSPSFVPNLFLEVSDKMSFTERLMNSIAFSLQFFFYDMVTPSGAVTNYVPDKPALSTAELALRAELHLLDLDPLLDTIKPIFPHYIYVGGMVAKPAKPLSGQLKEFMDSAKNGVVIVSFGSLLKGFPDEAIESLTKAFQKLKHLKFVYKQGEETVQKGNVLFMPWIPQNDLLGHPHTKLFITHCGNAGQIEALYHGVPMLGIPVNGDQFSNAKRMESKGYGTILKITDVTVANVVSKINVVFNNEKMTTAIKKAANIFRSRPQSPKERAAYWIDHVIQYGGGYLRPANFDMPFWKYILLDVILFLWFVIIAVLFVVIFITKKICSVCCGKRKSKID